MSNNPVKLKSVANNVEAELIINLLHNNNIECIKKSKESGDYMNIYMGYSIFGEDIYVNEDDYEAAIEVLNSLPNNEELIIDEDNNIDYHIPFYRNPRIVARIIILVMIGAVIVSTILNVVY